MPLPKIDKDALVTRVLQGVTRVVRRINSVTPQGSNEPRMYCSLCAVAVMSELESLGVDSLFQAGSAGWRMVPPDKDDGVSPTWFWHQFVLDEALDYVARGQFPEAHCWVVIPGDDPEFIDVTTAVLPQKCLMHGFTWQEEQPPGYLWLPGSQIPATVCYRPDPQAIRLSLSFARHALARARP